MRQLSKIGLIVATALLVGGSQVCAQSNAARAEQDLNNIYVTYRGGALIRNVKVSTLFWGQEWQGSGGPDYLNGFFEALFYDGGFMANLSQYSAGGYQIGNGQLVAADLDAAALTWVSESQIKEEIRAEIAGGNLPQPEADSLYVVYTPPDVLVVDDQGKDSVHDFAGFHGYDTEGGFAFALIAATQDAPTATVTSSHELAEAVTDPQVNAGTPGWYDNNNGEIGDIPQELFAAQLIDEYGLLDVLTGADGTRYLVQKIWSNQDGAPVAFAQPGINGAVKVKIGR